MNNMKTLAPIVIVYLNNRLPKYAIRNLVYLELTFPERNIYVVVSQQRHAKKPHKLRRTNFVHVKEIEKYLADLRAVTIHPQTFRNDFWNLTIARFFALESFMVEMGTKSIFHIEADVLLAPYFPFSRLEKLEKCIAFPRVSSKSAAASVFYVQDIKVLRTLNHFMKVSLLENPNLTDMGLLSDFSSKYKRLYVPLYSGAQAPLEEIEGIFDAATFGIFLTGGDPRNNRGRIQTFRDIEDHDAKPSEYVYYFSNDDRLIAKNSSQEFEIQNLHIHSKNSKYFQKSWPSRRLIIQVEKSTYGPRTEFSVAVFLNLSYYFIINRVKKIKKTFQGLICRYEN